MRTPPQYQTSIIIVQPLPHMISILSSQCPIWSVYCPASAPYDQCIVQPVPHMISILSSQCPIWSVYCPASAPYDQYIVQPLPYMISILSSQCPIWSVYCPASASYDQYIVQPVPHMINGDPTLYLVVLCSWLFFIGKTTRPWVRDEINGTESSWGDVTSQAATAANAAVSSWTTGTTDQANYPSFCGAAATQGLYLLLLWLVCVIVGEGSIDKFLITVF